MYSFLEYRYIVRSLMMGSEWQVAALIPKAELGRGDGGFPNGTASTFHEQSSTQAYSLS
jgi:hypothetical protein